jgi:hypothetical protein
MRRAMLAALSVVALALASPGAALAHHGHRGHHHHKGRANAHHARVHFEHFGAPVPTSSGTNAGSGGEETRMASPAEAVGTVTSFENEVLTIKLADESIVKGNVTGATEIECMSTSPTQSGDEEGSGEDEGSGDEESHEGDQQSSDEKGQSKEDEGDDNDAETVAAEPACGTSALTAGTRVREAELKIGPAGAEFESIELVK